MKPIGYYLSKNWRVTSPYGPRTHPLTGKQSFHNGVDFGIPLGGPLNAPVPTPFPGPVTAAAFYPSRGNTVVVRVEGTNVLQLFQHLHDFRCSVGDYLQEGGIVGLCGTTGDSTGVHLHYELRNMGSPWGDVWGDPAKYELAVEPPPEPSTAFAAGDWVRVTCLLRLNIRKEPGTAAEIVAQLDQGIVRQLADHPDSGIWADGHHWWKIAEGWVAEDWLERSGAPAEPTPEPLPPEPTPEPLPPEPEPTPEPEPDPLPQEPETPQEPDPLPPGPEPVGFWAMLLNALAELFQTILDGLRGGK